MISCISVVVGFSSFVATVAIVSFSVFVVADVVVVSGAALAFVDSIVVCVSAVVVLFSAVFVSVVPSAAIILVDFSSAVSLAVVISRDG